MTELTMVKRKALPNEVGLFVNAEVFESDFSNIKMGVEVKVVVTTPRSLKQLKYAWTLAKLVADGCDWLEAKEDAMEAMLIEARHFRRVYDKRRNLAYLRAKETNFGAMDGTDYTRLLKRIKYAVETVFMPGITDAALHAEIESMLEDKRMQETVKPERKARTPKADPASEPETTSPAVASVPHVPSADIDADAEREMLDRAGINEESEVVQGDGSAEDSGDSSPADRPGPPQTATEYMDRTRDWICKHTDPRGRAAAREIFSGEIHRDMRVAVRLSVAHRKLLEKEMDEHFEGLKAGARAKKS